MKLTHTNRKETRKEHFVRACLESGDAIRRAVTRAREAVLNEYAELAEEHARVLRLALNEAEALAWQTDFPHLFFPVLATEKAHAAVSWHRRQRALRRGVSEVAFSE